MAASDRSAVRIPHPHVTIDADGSSIVAGSRVLVRRLFAWHRQGTPVDTLIRRYPQLGPARVFDALSFAYDNLELVTCELDAERAALSPCVHCKRTDHRSTECADRPPGWNTCDMHFYLMPDGHCACWPTIFNVQANGLAKQTSKASISYQEALDLVFPTMLNGRTPTLTWTTTDGRRGTLAPGQLVTVSEGMTFDPPERS